MTGRHDDDAGERAGRRSSDPFLPVTARDKRAAALLAALLGLGSYGYHEQTQRADHAEHEVGVSQAYATALTERRDRSEDQRDAARRERDESQERRMDGIERRLETLEQHGGCQR